MLLIIKSFVQSYFFLPALALFILSSACEMLICILKKKTWERLNSKSANSRAISVALNNKPINLIFWPLVLIVMGFCFLPYAINHFNFEQIVAFVNSSNGQFPPSLFVALFIGPTLPIAPKIILYLTNKDFRDFVQQTGGLRFWKAVRVYFSKGL